MNKPSENILNQQNIPGWFPVMNPMKIIIVFFTLGGVYLILGIIAFANYNSLFFFEKYYEFDNKTSNGNNGSLTYLEINVERDIQKPIYVHYLLAAFYQNHIKFVDGGLNEASKFNDSFEFVSGPSNVVIDTSDVALESDRKRKVFKNKSDSDIIWAKVAPLPTFRKLYGVINEDMVKGEYVVMVKNNYWLPVLSKKAFVIQKTSMAFGGRNFYVGIVLMGTGGVMMIMGAACVIINIITPRKLGHYHRKYGPDFADTRLAAASSGDDFYNIPAYLKTTDSAFAAMQFNNKSVGEGRSKGAAGSDAL